MKEKITSLVLVLVVAMSMTVGASAASYIPDDVTYQNLNGQQLAIKTYTLLPDQDPADLYEEDFEHDGFLYQNALRSGRGRCSAGLRRCAGRPDPGAHTHVWLSAA